MWGRKTFCETVVRVQCFQGLQKGAGKVSVGRSGCGAVRSHGNGSGAGSAAGGSDTRWEVVYCVVLIFDISLNLFEGEARRFTTVD